MELGDGLRLSVTIPWQGLPEPWDEEQQVHGMLLEQLPSFRMVPGMYRPWPGGILNVEKAAFQLESSAPASSPPNLPTASSVTRKIHRENPVLQEKVLSTGGE